jgi:acyl carrier protein
MPTQHDVIEVVRKFLKNREREVPALGLETELYQDGLGLESLDAAELSAMLESAFGTDPYSEGELPQTIGEILAFYDRLAAA